MMFSTGWHPTRHNSVRPTIKKEVIANRPEKDALIPASLIERGARTGLLDVFQAHDGDIVVLLVAVGKLFHIGI